MKMLALYKIPGHGLFQSYNIYKLVFPNYYRRHKTSWVGRDFDLEAVHNPSAFLTKGRKSSELASANIYNASNDQVIAFKGL